MKLNRGLMLVAALAVGSAAMMGCKGSSDAGAKDSAGSDQVVATNDVAETANAADEGVTQYARWGHGRGFRAGERAGFRRGERNGFRRGERREWRRDRPWYRFW